MLKSIKFSNAYSFTDETVFSLEADVSKRDNSCFIRTVGEHNVLPSVALYGANGAGKTNLLCSIIKPIRQFATLERLNQLRYVSPSCLAEVTLVLGTVHYVISFSLSGVCLTKTVDRTAVAVSESDFQAVRDWCRSVNNYNELAVGCIRGELTEREQTHLSQILSAFDPSIDVDVFGDFGTPPKIIYKSAHCDSYIISRGTRKLIEVLVLVFDALKHSSLLLVDDLDSHLHPEVLQSLVYLFNNPETNPRNAQLVFTAHNTAALQNEYVRRDGVYIVHKDERGQSDLARLSDYTDERGNPLRSHENYEKLYRDGVLGSYPEKFRSVLFKKFTSQ